MTVRDRHSHFLKREQELTQNYRGSLDVEVDALRLGPAPVAYPYPEEC